MQQTQQLDNAKQQISRKIRISSLSAVYGSLCLGLSQLLDNKNMENISNVYQYTGNYILGASVLYTVTAAPQLRNLINAKLNIAKCNNYNAQKYL